MRYVHTNKDPEEIDYVIPGNDGDTYGNRNLQTIDEETDYVIPVDDGDTYKENSNPDDDLIIFDENEDDEDKTFEGATKFVLSGVGLLIGTVALGVGLSGALKGTEKGVALVAGAGITSFSLVKCVKSVMTMVGIKPEENKKLTKAITKE